MSVLITGIDMPKTCRECPLEQPYDGYNCAITGKSYSWALSERPSDCPLIPVPPHGDLIDKDKFRKTMFIGEQCLYSWDEIEDAIDFAPAVIPADPQKEET